MKFTVYYEKRGVSYYAYNLTGSQVAWYKRHYNVYEVRRTK